MRTMIWLAALALALAAFAADGRYLLTLEKALPDGAARTLALDCVKDAFTLAGGDASAVKLDGTKLRGKVTVGDAWYDLDCVVTPQPPATSHSSPASTTAPSPARR